MKPGRIPKIKMPEKTDVVLPNEPNISPSDIRDLVNECSPGPNYIHHHRKVDTKFNIQAWQKYEHVYKDSDPNLLSQITYGFPIPYDFESPPSVPFRNHTSAYQNPEIIDKYILKNIENGSLYGPFESNPLDVNVTVSPLQVSYSSSGKPRVVVDCSWGSPSVNHGISDDWTQYPGYSGDFHLPSVDDLVNQVLTTPKPVKLWKADLEQYYKQIIIDPGDIHYLGFILLFTPSPHATRLPLFMTLLTQNFTLLLSAMLQGLSSLHPVSGFQSQSPPSPFRTLSTGQQQVTLSSET